MVLTYEFAHDCLKEYKKTSHRHMNNIKNFIFTGGNISNCF